MADLRTLPAIRAEAERLARENYDTRERPWRERGAIRQTTFARSGDRDEAIEIQLDLLCDLTRPASRNAIIRMCIEADIRGMDDQAEISAIITEWTSYRDDIERIAYLAPVSLGASND